MANNVIPFEIPANMLDTLRDMFGTGNSDLTAGVQESFGTVSFKGKVWRVKYKGEERIVKTPDGDPAPSLIAVLVKSSPQISKIFYPGAYTEGDNDAPTCFSIDGVRPDPASLETQAPTCAACPKNIWGSKVTEQGNKTKACSDSRRIAIVPYPDLRNPSFGGPLLLRIPPASLQELSMFSRSLDTIGVPYQAVVVKITFDMELAYPKLKFQAIKGLTADEAAIVKELMAGDEIGRMLASAPITEDAMTPAQATQQPAGPAPADAQAKAKEPVVAEPVVAEPKAKEPDPIPEPKVEKKSPKEANAATGEPVSEELDGLLGTLL